MGKPAWRVTIAQWPDEDGEFPDVGRCVESATEEGYRMVEVTVVGPGDGLRAALKAWVEVYGYRPEVVGRAAIWECDICHCTRLADYVPRRDLEVA